MRNLPCRRIQVDELWRFNYCKDPTSRPEIRAKAPRARLRRISRWKEIPRHRSSGDGK
jgi:hypothetical protein